MSRRPKICAALTVLLVVLVSCTTDPAPISSPGNSAGAGSTIPGAGSGASLFGQGCPVAKQSLARQMNESSGPMDGPRVVGGPGDYLLANEAAAFVISAPVSEKLPQRTWYHYGGIVVDAAAIDGCKQVAPDRIDEIGLVVGSLTINDFASSILRAFRADKIDVLNDGKDGKTAVVRATGSDDYLELIEYQLIRQSAAGGTIKPRSKPFGVRVEVDYALEPGDAALKITMRIVAETAGPRALLGAALVTWGDELDPISRPESTIDLGGFALGLGVPWQIAQGEGGSYAFAAANANQAIAEISGVNAFIDVNQAFDAPLKIDKVGDSSEMSFLLAVSPTDANRAARAILARDPEVGPGTSALEPVAGTTVDTAGKPVGGVRIEMQMRRGEGEWATYDVAASDAAGKFETSAVVLQDAKGTDPDVRLRLMADGRAPVLVDVPTGDGASGPAVTGELELGPVGAIEAKITDDAGAELPARLTLYQEGKVVQAIDTAKAGKHPVAPGAYDLVVSRGYEHERVESSIVVPDDGSVAVTAQLKRVVDTKGWVAVDTHVHSGPSTDSSVLPERRYLDAAVTGVEVVVNTNHEVIEDLGEQLKNSGLAPFVAAITGQEVTASSPEHTTMFPVTSDGSVRGGIPLWYGLDLGEIYALEKKRGAKIRGLNHPTGYLELIEWDPVTATPGVTDGRVLGLDEDAEVWSWDFEQVELQNGTQPVLRSNADDEGLFDFWQSAHNHGRFVTAVGASDTHGVDIGDVMTYVQVDDDDPSKITPDQIAHAIASGRAMISTGAFAEVRIGTGEIGSTVAIDSGRAEVAIKVQAIPGIDVSSIMVFSNCDLVATIPVTNQGGVIRYDDKIVLDLAVDSNITVLGFGSAAMPRPFHKADPVRVPRFTTNPVFVSVDGDGDFDAPGDKACAYPR